MFILGTGATDIDYIRGNLIGVAGELFCPERDSVKLRWRIFLGGKNVLGEIIFILLQLFHVLQTRFDNKLCIF